MSKHQGTLADSISFNGPGLHTAGRHTITLLPAAENTGIIFRRMGKQGKHTDILASWRNTKPLPLCTCIVADNGLHVRTIEHLMAAFYACGIDNVVVEVEGDEIPVLDGSAQSFIKKIDAVGIVQQSQPRAVYEVTQAIEFREDNRFIRIEPADTLSIDITISLAKIGRLNWNGVVTPELFKQEMAAARTFGRLKNGLLAQLSRFQKDPICLGANTKSAVVIVGDKAINKGGLRMPDEYIRHRVLDLVGDLMLSGGHIHGKITAFSTAHRLNHELLRGIFENKESYDRR
ncbi:MAG: UDP-3-O-acyl-N-acetylglucosamine deacetylase [Thiotrichaceae bacterium]